MLQGINQPKASQATFLTLQKNGIVTTDRGKNAPVSAKASSLVSELYVAFSRIDFSYMLQG